MRYSAIIEQVFEVTSVSGSEHLCFCPFHEDTSQGHLYANGDNGYYICFSCNAKGHVEKLSDEVPPLETEDVRSRLRSVATKKQRKEHVYPEGWLRQFSFPTDYWTVERGISEDVVKRLGLGYDPIMDQHTMPLRNLHGDVLGVSRRRPDGKPKYQHPKGFPVGKHLYAAWLLRGETTVGITEGQVDCAMAWTHRVPAVSTLGARITADQIRVLQLLGVRKVVAMYDNDSAGRKGTAQMYQALQGSGIRFVAGWYRPYWFVSTDEGKRLVKDPGELTGSRMRKFYHSGIDIRQWIEHTGFEG